MSRVNQGQTQSDQVDHQETENRTHDGDELSPKDVDADSVKAGGVPVKDQLTQLGVGLDEARLAAGLNTLDFDDGWIDTLKNLDLVSSQSSLTAFDGDVAISSGGSGSLTTTTQSLSFTPTEAVIAHTITTGTPGTRQNDDSFSYDVPVGVDVSNVSASVTGKVNTQTGSDSYNTVKDGDAVSVSVGGNQSTDVDVSYTGANLRTSPTTTDFTESESLNEADAAMDDVGNVGVVIVEDYDAGVTEARFYDIRDINNPTETVLDLSGRPNEVLIASDASLAAVAVAGTTDGSTLQNGIELYDISDPASPTLINKFNDEGVVTMGMPADGSFIVCDSTRVVSNPENFGAEVFDISDPNNPSFVDVITRDHIFDNVTVSRDGSTTAWVNSQGEARFADTSDLSSISSNLLNLTDDGGVDVDLDDTGDNAVTTFENTSVYWVDGIPGSPNLVNTYSTLSEPEDISIDDAGEQAVAMGYPSEFYYFNVDDTSTVTATAGDNADGNSVITGDGNYAFHITSAGDVYLVDTNDPGSVTNILTVPSPHDQLYASPQVNTDGTKGVFTVNSTSIANMPASVTDPSLTIDGSTASFSGTVGANETQTVTASGVSPGSYSPTFDSTTGAANIDLQYTETTQTKDPSIEIASGAGTQTASYSGVVADGDTVDISDSIDPSQIDGSVTVTLTASAVDSPAGQAVLNYSHEGIDAGGAIQYIISDGNGNSVYLPVDTVVDVSALTSGDLTLSLNFYDAFGDVSISDYAAYFQA